MLKAFIDAKGTEDDEKQEEIVDAEGFFDQIAGEKFQRGLASPIVKYADAEQQGQDDPHNAGDRGFLHLHLVQAPAEYTEIKGDCD